MGWLFDDPPSPVLPGPKPQYEKGISVFAPPKQDTPLISDFDGIASGQTLHGDPLANVFSDEVRGQSTNQPPEPTNLSSILDLKQVSKDMAAAQAGDSAAKARVRAMADSPAVTNLEAKKATSKSPGFDFSKGMGFSSSMGSVMPSIEDEMPRPNVMPVRDAPGGIPTATPKPAGGGGVEVPEQEKKQGLHWGTKLGIIGDTLINIGNAFSQGHRMPTSGTIDQLMQQRQQEQLSQLKMRHDMWADAYKQAQALPSDVLADPGLSSLAQAKAALEKDMMDGKIDNEKNVSGFLTELARHKSTLEGLMKNSAATQAVAAEEAALTARGNRMAELQQAAKNGDQQAALILSLIPPSAREQFDLNKANVEADNRRQQQQADWQREYQKLALQDRAYGRSQDARNRQDVLDDRAAGRRGQYITSSFENAITRRLPDRKTLSEMDPAEAEKLVSSAQRAALDEIAPRLDAAAQAAGLNIVYDVTMPKPFKVGDQYFDTKQEVTMYLLGQLGG